MAKKKTLFEQEMEKPGFKRKYNRERKDFELEVQILQALEDIGLTYEQFAAKIGTSKGNVSRDLKIRGLGKASIERIQKMAEVLGMEFVPLLLPRDRKLRKEKITEMLSNVS